MLKMGFNEGCTWDGNRGCADQSLMADLKACAKYGFKGIDIENAGGRNKIRAVDDYFLLTPSSTASRALTSVLTAWTSIWQKAARWKN